MGRPTPRPEDHAQEPPPGRLAYTMPEAAWVLGVAPWTVANLVKRGELATVRLGSRGGSIRIPRQSVEDFITRGGVAKAEATS